MVTKSANNMHAVQTKANVMARLRQTDLLHNLLNEDRQQVCQHLAMPVQRWTGVDLYQVHLQDVTCSDIGDWWTLFMVQECLMSVQQLCAHVRKDAASHCACAQLHHFDASLDSYV